jgi:hypothetical protein
MRMGMGPSSDREDTVRATDREFKIVSSTSIKVKTELVVDTAKAKALAMMVLATAIERRTV